MRSLLPLLAVVAATAAPRLAMACAGCRNPNLPITRLATTSLSPGQLRAAVLLSATSVDVVHQAGCPDPATCSERPVQPAYLHDQSLYPAELRAVAELGLSRRWGVELQLPVRVTWTRIRYTDLAGAPYEPIDRDVHHRDETVAGPGDPWLLGRLAEPLLGGALTLRAGVSLPLGRIEDDPFTLGAQGVRHQHIQLGNGTVDPVLMIDLSRTVARVDLGAYAQAQITLYENRKGFRAGHRFSGGAQAGMLVLPKLTVALGLDLLGERPERWAGQIQQDGNLGRTELLAGVSVTRPFGATVASLMVRLPVYRRIVTGDDPHGKLSSPVMLSLILSRIFGKATAS